MKKNVPVLYKSKDNCCGCSACFAICPRNAISMEPDEEGFLYPRINETLCIRCERCISVCVFKNDQYSRGYCTPENGEDR